MKIYSLYPKIDITDTDTEFTIKTTLRKEHEGSWYLWNFVQPLIFGKKTTEQEKINAVNNFHKQVYLTVICGVVTPNLTDFHGEKIFHKDESQKTESERLKTIIKTVCPELGEQRPLSRVEIWGEPKETI